MINTKYKDAAAFASVLKATDITDNRIKFGSFYIDSIRGVHSKIRYNEDGLDLLDNKHEYTFRIAQGDLQISLQLYENVSNHYRLFAYTRANDKQGMVFSMNLTTERESNNVIFLTQKIGFKEHHPGDNKLASAKRRQKQILLCEVLRRLGLDVTDNNDLVLGIFDPENREFVNTSPTEFLNDFIGVSLLKGHFMGNKGYCLDILPSYQKDVELIIDDTLNGKEAILPKKVSEKKTKRAIPLAYRYQVFKRDGSRCVACGKSVNDGAKLHIDHKVPYSLGGLTVLENLQTLCAECNLSKSNRFVD